MRSWPRPLQGVCKHPTEMQLLVIPVTRKLSGKCKQAARDEVARACFSLSSGSRDSSAAATCPGVHSSWKPVSSYSAVSTRLKCSTRSSMNWPRTSSANSPAAGVCRNSLTR